MKQALLCLLMLGCVLTAAEGAGTPLLAGDPFILLSGGKYYCYGTNHDEGILVYESDDLKVWRLCQNGRGGLALHKSDTSAHKWFWAPEVYPDGKGFAMYFTREERISCARSATPTGPFVEVNRKPMYKVPERRIDSTRFIDDDGKAYVFFSRILPHGMEIWGAELTPDRATLREKTLFRCLGPEKPWERIDGRVTEGPFVLKHKGKYYLTYSANGYTSHDYAVGYAVAKSPRGPYHKAKENPILRRPPGFVGAGHHSFFRDKEGRLRIVFHVHNSPKQVHPRRVLIGTAFFHDGRLVIAPEIIRPVVVP